MDDYTYVRGSLLHPPLSVSSLRGSGDELELQLLMYTLVCCSRTLKVAIRFTGCHYMSLLLDGLERVTNERRGSKSRILYMHFFVRRLVKLCINH